jgi:hypothetical protein
MLGRSAKTSGSLAIAQFTANTATSATTLHGTAKDVELAKQDVR